MLRRKVVFVFLAGFLRSFWGVIQRPLHLILSFFQPLLWTFFLYVAIAGRHGSKYDGEVGDYLIPAIGLISVVFVSSQTAISVIRDLQFGVLSRIRTNSLKPYAVFLGKLTFDLVRSGVQSLALMLMTHSFLPVDTVTYADMLVLTALYLPFGAFYVSFSALVAIWAKRQEYVAVFVNLFNLPLIFTSTIVMPKKGFDGWLGVLSDLNLLSFFVNAGRAWVVTGEMTLNEIVLGSVMVLIVLLNMIISNKLKGI